MFKIVVRRPEMWVGILLGIGLLGTFGVSLFGSTFIGSESSILRLSLLSWWRDVPLIFSRDFLMFSDGQFRPLSYALMAVVRTFVRADNVFLWHLWMLAFHWLNTVLVFVLVRHYARHVGSAILAAGLFGLHPLASVVVLRMEYFHYVLGLTFYLSALCTYLAFTDTPRKRTYIAALSWFLLGVLTSKVVFTLPLLLAGIEVLYERSSPRTVLTRLLPFIGLSLALSPLWIFYRPHPLYYKYMDFPADAGWYSFFSVIGTTGWYAKGLLLGWGIPVILHEVVEQIFRFLHWKVLLWGAVNLGVVLAAGWAVRRKYWAGWGVLLLYSTLLPFATTAWNGVRDYVSWAYLYFPTVGLALLVGGIAEGWWPRRGRDVRVGVVVLLGLIGVYYGVQQVRVNSASRSALRYWTRVLHLNPESETAAAELGKAYLQRGDVTQALRLLFSPKTKQVHEPCLTMSQYYRAQGAYLAAAIHLRMAGHQETGLQFQDYEQAAAELLYAAGAPDHAEDALGITLMANPYNIAAMEQLAEIWIFKGYVAAARRWMEQALKLSPSDPGLARLWRRLEAFRRSPSSSENPKIVHPPAPGWLRYVIEGLREYPIRQEIIQVSEQHPADPMIQLEAGICLLRNGEYDWALSKLDIATRSLSSYPYAWAIKCWAAAEAGAYEEAVAAGRRAQELDPQNSIVNNILGILFSTLAGDPQSPVYQRRLEWAIQYYQRAIQLSPRDAAAHNNLGDAFQRAGRFDEAIEEYRQAARLGPALAEPHYNLGNLLSAQGKLDEAIEEYRKALQSRPDFAEAHNNLGVALQRQGKLQEAIYHFQQTLRIHPGDTKAQENLNMARIEMHSGMR